MQNLSTSFYQDFDLTFAHLDVKHGFKFVCFYDPILFSRLKKIGANPHCLSTSHPTPSVRWWRGTVTQTVLTPANWPQTTPSTEGWVQRWAWQESGLEVGDHLAVPDHKWWQGSLDSVLQAHLATDPWSKFVQYFYFLPISSNNYFFFH